MRKDIDLIGSALAEHKIEEFEVKEISFNEEIHTILYYIYLDAERYSGIQKKWYFLIIKDTSSKTTSKQMNDKVNAVRENISVILKKKLVPILVISDDPSINVIDKMRFENHPVFFINSDKLPGKTRYSNEIRNAPIIKSIKHKISAKRLSIFQLTPFTPNNPATEWQFHGRKKELTKLLHTNDSFFVIGARRIGKTSLLLETERLLKEKGERVVYVSVQNLSSVNEVISEIINSLSAREGYRAKQRAEIFNEDLLASVIKTTCRTEKVTIILDEIGNVIVKDRKDSWRLIGILRDFSQRGKLKVIMSGFQEYVIQQITDPGGPYVNFAEVMPLYILSENEVKDILVNPLKIWGTITR